MPELEGLVFSDDDGYFQGEVSTRITTLESDIDGKPCSVDISSLQAENGVIRAKRLYCKPAAAASTDDDADNTTAEPADDADAPAKATDESNQQE